MTVRDVRGFSLVELAVAATLAAIALAALLGFAMAAQSGLDAEPAAADAQQRLRAAAAVLREAVQDAGSGFLLDPIAPRGMPCRRLRPSRRRAGHGRGVSWPVS